MPTVVVAVAWVAWAAWTSKKSDLFCPRNKSCKQKPRLVRGFCFSEMAERKSRRCM